MEAIGIAAVVQEKINDIKKTSDEELMRVKADNALTEEQKKERQKELRKKKNGS